MRDGHAELRELLLTLDPHARGTLRRVLIHDQADRDAVSSQLLRYRDGHGDGWADINRHAHDASGGAAASGTAAWRDRGRRDILILALSTLCSPICG
jgi:hypothetical protein